MAPPALLLGRRLLAAASALALAALPGHASPRAPQGPGAGGAPAADEARMRRAWSFLRADEQRETLEWLAAEVEGLDTLQARLIASVRSSITVDAGLWPEEEAPPIYDPAVHAPRLKAGPRRVLAPDDSRVRRAREELLPAAAPGALRPEWTYDWAAGQPVKARDFDPLADGFENALAGYPPGLSLARAWLLSRLDRGEERHALAAFAHAYGDREGHVFPGLTLYDAWSSGREIEMPDADALGVLHDLTGDWKSYVSPVPDRKHDSLYGRIAELFVPASRYRALREALADVFAIGEPVGLGVYAPNTTRFHALWDQVENDPDALAARLPDAKKWQDFLADWIRTCDKDGALRARGEARQAELRRDAAAVRERLAFVLQGMGAFDRDHLPPPPAPPPAPADDH